MKRGICKHAVSMGQYRITPENVSLCHRLDTKGRSKPEDKHFLQTARHWPFFPKAEFASQTGQVKQKKGYFGARGLSPKSGLQDFDRKFSIISVMGTVKAQPREQGGRIGLNGCTRAEIPQCQQWNNGVGEGAPSGRTRTIAGVTAKRCL